MNRKKIGKITAVFLVFILGCTGISRITHSMTVAKVEIVEPRKATISREVKATGKIEENQQKAVYTEANQKVETIFVKEGQSVKTGEVLFQVENKSLQEKIQTCQQELEGIKLDVQDAASSQTIKDTKEESALTRAQEDYNLAVSKGDQAVEWAAFELTAAQDRLNDYYSNQTTVEESEGDQVADEASLTDAVNAAQKAYDEAVTAREEGIVTAQRAVDDAKVGEASDSTLEHKQLEQQQKESELAKLSQLEKAQGKVVSPVDAVITEVSIKTGELTTETAAILLADMTGGCRFVASVDKSQEKYLEKNASVILENVSDNIVVKDLRIDSIKVNEEDSGLLDVIVYVAADAFELGSSADMVVTKKEGDYDTCIPLQALHEENGIYYIYVAEERETVLGTQWMVIKVTVSVAIKDSSNAALTEGSLTEGQKIIVDTDKEIKDGSEVRLTED